MLNDPVAYLPDELMRPVAAGVVGVEVYGNDALRSYIVSVHAQVCGRCLHCLRAEQVDAAGFVSAVDMLPVTAVVLDGPVAASARLKAAVRRLYARCWLQAKAHGTHLEGERCGREGVEQVEPGKVEAHGDRGRDS